MTTTTENNEPWPVYLRFYVDLMDPGRVRRNVRIVRGKQQQQQKKKKEAIRPRPFRNCETFKSAISRFSPQSRVVVLLLSGGFYILTYTTKTVSGIRKTRKKKMSKTKKKSVNFFDTGSRGST